MDAAARVPNGLPVRIEKGETNAGAPMLAKRPEPPPGVGGGAIAESARSEEVREAVREALYVSLWSPSLCTRTTGAPTQPPKWLRRHDGHRTHSMSSSSLWRLLLGPLLRLPTSLGLTLGLAS